MLFIYAPDQAYIAAKAKIPGYVESVKEELPLWDIQEETAVEKPAGEEYTEASERPVTANKEDTSNENEGRAVPRVAEVDSGAS